MLFQVGVIVNRMKEKRRLNTVLIHHSHLSSYVFRMSFNGQAGDTVPLHPVETA
jgi:hypothetical protein